MSPTRSRFERRHLERCAAGVLGLMAAVAWLAAPAYVTAAEPAAKHADAHDHDGHDSAGHDTHAESGEHGDAHGTDGHGHAAHDDGHGAGHKHTIHGVPPRSNFGPRTEFLYVNPELLVWTLLMFVPLWAILSAVVWRPVLHAMEKREEGLAKIAAESASLRGEAAELVARQNDALAQAHRDAKRLIDEAREAAAKECDALLRASQQQTQQSADAALASIAATKEEALARLRESAVGMAGRIAERVAGKALDHGALDAVSRESMS